MTENQETVKRGMSNDTSTKDEQKVPLETVSITMDKRGDLAVALGTAIFGAFILIISLGIDKGSIPDPITSRGLPMISGTFLLIAGIVLAVRQIIVWTALPGNLVPQEGQEDDQGYPASWVRASGIMLASVLSVLLLKSLGYLIVTPLFIFVASLFMGVRSWMKLIAFPILLSASNWVLFGPILGINVPLGILERVARSLGIIW